MRRERIEGRDVVRGAGALLRSRVARQVRGIRTEDVTRAVTTILVAVAYYIAARLSLRLAIVGMNVTPLWPPTGIALVAFLMLGRGVWPGITVAAFAVNAPISTSLVAAAATAAGNTLAPVLAAEFLQRVGFRKEIDRLRDASAIVAAALGGMAVSASVGAGLLVLSNAIPGRDFGGAWAVWWTGDAMGVLVVAPFLLNVLQFPWHPRASWGDRFEAAVLFVSLTALTIAVTRSRLSTLFLILPVLGWAAWRFQLRGAAPAALVATGIASWAAARGWGPFAEGTLVEKMVILQAFNATVAITSFVFAALVSERVRARDELERAAADLEDRVRRRTAALSSTNERLIREIAERREAERRLRQRERQLADAQRMARVGSWEWVIGDERITWSDEMFRIHGHRPKAFPVTFTRAVEQIVPEDLVRIQESLGASLRATTDQDIPGREYRIVRPDGVERVLMGKAKVEVGPTGGPLRLIGTVQDITEDKRAEREHRIAETLQRSLLPDRLPDIPGVLLTARYVPASADAEVGGDWYDVVQLPTGQVAVAIGDVAGHGLRAASTMAQLRMGLRAYAIEEDAPVAVVRRVHELAQRLALPQMATLIYLVFDPERGTLTFANAGHPPPVILEPEGRTRFLEGGLAPPLGGATHAAMYLEQVDRLPDGSTLVLFSDGLVERRGRALADGLARLGEEALASGPGLDALCDHLLASMVGPEISDDIALLALRPVPLGDGPLTLRVPAEPGVLAPLRYTLRRWLGEAGASREEINAVLVSAGEACANVIQHAYGAREGPLEITLTRGSDAVDLTVRDTGRWRASSPPPGGRGIRLMQGLMDHVEIEQGSQGTVVRMRHRLGGRSSG